MNSPNLMIGSDSVIQRSHGKLSEMLSREARDFGDLYGGASGSGYGSSCPEGIPVELALLSILAAFGVAFGILYTALTLITGGRRKREIGQMESWENFMGDYFWYGKLENRW